MVTEPVTASVSATYCAAGEATVNVPAMAPYLVFIGYVRWYSTAPVSQLRTQRSCVSRPKPTCATTTLRLTWLQASTVGPGLCCAFTPKCASFVSGEPGRPTEMSLGDESPPTTLTRQRCRLSSAQLTVTDGLGPNGSGRWAPVVVSYARKLSPTLEPSGDCTARPS